MWICASQQIALLLQDERRVEFGRSGHDEFRCGPHRVQHRALTCGDEWLTRATVRAENVVSSDASTAETAVDRLHLRGLAADVRRGYAVTDAPRHQVFQMPYEFVPQFACSAETIFRFVLDRAHQEQFHLGRDRGIDLPWPRVLREVEDQQRIVLRVRAG